VATLNGFLTTWHCILSAELTKTSHTFFELKNVTDREMLKYSYNCPRGQDIGSR